MIMSLRGLEAATPGQAHAQAETGHLKRHSSRFAGQLPATLRNGLSHAPRGPAAGR
jgi:hypothetical protein